MKTPLVLTSALVLAASSRADDPLAYVRTEGGILGNPSGQGSMDSGFQAAGPVSGHFAASGNVYGTDIEGSYDARADYGDLSGAFAVHSQNSASSGAFVYATYVTAIDPTSRFRDRLAIVSATLPAGTPVAIDLSGLLTGGFATSTSGNPAGLHAETSVTATYRWQANANVGGTSYSSSGALSFDESGFGGVQSASVVAYVGGTLDLDARLYVTGDAFTNSYGPVADAGASADGRFRAGVSVLTPGADYDALSGHRYGAVPEPATLVAFGAGIAGIVRRRKR